MTVCRRGSLAFAFLDGREPQLLLALYTGGVHCCWVLQVLDFNGQRPRSAAIDFGNAGGALQWIGGHPYFLSADDRFAYVFTCFACSGFPIRIWRYADAHFQDVTRDFPSLVAKDALKWWRFTADPRWFDRRGVAAAWAADEALLGRAALARSRLDQLADKGKLNGFDPAGPSKPGRTYVAKLWRYLAQTGYLHA